MEPAELVPEYVKLFQAVHDNDVNIVEEMSQNLVFAVRDKLNMSPFTLACFRGHNELAIKILDIVASQYEPKNNIVSLNEMDAINNYDIGT
jgi:ankyrin repeat protein